MLTHRHGHLDGAAAYLETTTPDNRCLYARHGYTDLGELRVPGGPPLWRMLRPPTPNLTEPASTETNAEHGTETDAQ